MNVSTLEAEALHLPVEDRAKLAHKLLESLDILSESEVEELWISEAENRLSEIRSGVVNTISAHQFQSDAEALFS